MPATASAIWKTGDTYPPLAATLSDSNGTIVLTTASQVDVRIKGTTVPSPALITGVCSIASAAGGYVTYAWGPSDTWIADVYNVEYPIYWSSGGTETVPNNGYAGPIQFYQDL